jgi:hypothetical protein
MVDYDGDFLAELCAEPGSDEATAICMLDSVSKKRGIRLVSTAFDKFLTSILTA